MLECHTTDAAQVKRFEVHKSTVNDLCFDEAAEHLASCSDDGSAAVHLILHLICLHKSANFQS